MNLLLLLSLFVFVIYVNVLVYCAVDSVFVKHEVPLIPFIPNPVVHCQGDQCKINHLDLNLKLVKSSTATSPDYSILKCHKDRTHLDYICSDGLVAMAKWTKTSELHSQLDYEFCIAPNKEKRQLDTLIGIQIVHYHENHKAYDQIYDICSQHSTHLKCQKLFHSKARCVSGSIEHLPIRFESPDYRQGTFMEIQLIAKLDDKLVRTQRQRAHKERILYTITDATRGMIEEEEEDD